MAGWIQCRSKVHLCNLGTATCLMNCTSHASPVQSGGGWGPLTKRSQLRWRCNHVWAKVFLRFFCQMFEPKNLKNRCITVKKIYKKQGKRWNKTSSSVEFWSGAACDQEVERSFDLQQGWEGSDLGHLHQQTCDDSLPHHYPLNPPDVRCSIGTQVIHHSKSQHNLEHH